MEVFYDERKRTYRLRAVGQVAGGLLGVPDIPPVEEGPAGGVGDSPVGVGEVGQGFDDVSDAEMADPLIDREIYPAAPHGGLTPGPFDLDMYPSALPEGLTPGLGAAGGGAGVSGGSGVGDMPPAAGEPADGVGDSPVGVGDGDSGADAGYAAALNARPLGDLPSLGDPAVKVVVGGVEREVALDKWLNNMRSRGRRTELGLSLVVALARHGLEVFYDERKRTYRLPPTGKHVHWVDQHYEDALNAREAGDLPSAGGVVPLAYLEGQLGVPLGDWLKNMRSRGRKTRLKPSFVGALARHGLEIFYDERKRTYRLREFGQVAGGLAGVADMPLVVEESAGGVGDSPVGVGEAGGGFDGMADVEMADAPPPPEDGDDVDETVVSAGARALLGGVSGGGAGAGSVSGAGVSGPEAAESSRRRPRVRRQVVRGGRHAVRVERGGRSVPGPAAADGDSAADAGYAAALNARPLGDLPSQKDPAVKVVVGGVEKEVALGAWLNTMRSNGRKTELGPSLVEALARHGLVVFYDERKRTYRLPPTGKQVSWLDQHYADALNAREVGDLPSQGGVVPLAYLEGHPGVPLGAWLNTMRSAGRKTELGPSLVEALARHGLVASLDANGYYKLPPTGRQVSWLDQHYEDALNAREAGDLPSAGGVVPLAYLEGHPGVSLGDWLQHMRSRGRKKRLKPSFVGALARHGLEVFYDERKRTYRLREFGQAAGGLAGVPDMPLVVGESAGGVGDSPVGVGEAGEGFDDVSDAEMADPLIDPVPSALLEGLTPGLGAAGGAGVSGGSVLGDMSPVVGESAGGVGDSPVGVGEAGEGFDGVSDVEMADASPLPSVSRRRPRVRRQVVRGGRHAVRVERGGRPVPGPAAADGDSAADAGYVAALNARPLGDLPRQKDPAVKVVVGGVEKEVALGAWLHTMRSKGRKTELGPSLVEALARHGLVASLDEEGRYRLPRTGKQVSWLDQHYADALNAREVGDLPSRGGVVPLAYLGGHPGVPLGDWLRTLRTKGRKTELEPSLVVALARHGLVVSLDADGYYRLPLTGKRVSWLDQHYEDALNAREVGDLPSVGGVVPLPYLGDHPGVPLGDWLHNMRTRGRKTELEPSLVVALARHGLVVSLDADGYYRL
ncbi:hypothetical protein ACFW2K_35425, partial [Streptomyces nigra]